MREFKVLPKVQDFEFNLIEKIINKEIPGGVKEYIKKYGGDAIIERYFRDRHNLEWELSQFNKFNDLYGLTKEFFEVYKRKLIPFAFDPGGWHFCLCLDEKDYGSIFINRWTDHLPEDQFLKIADSFDEFINGLQAEGVDER